MKNRVFKQIEPAMPLPLGVRADCGIPLPEICKADLDDFNISEESGPGAEQDAQGRGQKQVNPRYDVTGEVEDLNSLGEAGWGLIFPAITSNEQIEVLDGSKRMREPRVLSVDEFLQILEHIPEPFRTMCIVAMCMGLRVSEVLGLKWCDVDWEGLRIRICQSYVYGKPGAVKTPASKRWLPLGLSLAKKLRQHQLRYASPANKDDWVFANPVQESRTGLAEFKRTGLFLPQKRWG